MTEKNPGRVGRLVVGFFLKTAYEQKIKIKVLCIIVLFSVDSN